MLKTMNALEEQARAAAAKVESERVSGTKPSLALDKYAGDYQSDMYGDATVGLDNGTLTLRRGRNFTGTLEHWHYDVFRVTWSDRQLGKQFVSFRLDQKGQIAEMNIENIDDFPRKLRHNPIQCHEPATRSSGAQRDRAAAQGAVRDELRARHPAAHPHRQGVRPARDGRVRRVCRHGDTRSSTTRRSIPRG